MTSSSGLTDQLTYAKMTTHNVETGEVHEDIDKHFWKPSSSIPLDDFLKKSRPSMVQQTGPGTSWICVSVQQEKEEDEPSEAVAEGKKIYKTLQEKLQEIKDDPAKYPKNSKKLQTAKAAREELQLIVQAAQVAIKGIEEIAKKHEYTAGKWMFFTGNDYVDSTFATLARSVAEGPLHKDGTITLCKAATCDPAREGEQHLICLYMDDIWDVEASKRILQILAGEHGLIPSSAKPDIYTAIGIAGGVAQSGMPSSIGNPDKMMKDEGGIEALKTLQSEHQKHKSKPRDTREISPDSEEEKQAKTGEKRAAEPDETTSKKARPAVKKTAKQVAKENDIFGGASDSE